MSWGDFPDGKTDVFFTQPSTGVFFTWPSLEPPLLDPLLESSSLDPLWNLLVWVTCNWQSASRSVGQSWILGPH